MKKPIIVILCLMFLILLIFSGCSGQKSPVPVVEPAPVTDKTDNPSVPVEPKAPELPGALLVMVDNYLKARPQSGLDKADLVYEMMAEGGITRFMALFYQQSAVKIGPVRSARYYFVQLAKGYDSPLAHAGGSQEALQMIFDIKMKDLDEIYNAGGYFWRDKTRSMPHNLYTSTEQLLKGAQAKGYKLVVPPAFGVAAGEGEGTVHDKDMIIDYSSKTYNYKVVWHYNGQRYERDINGNPHLMEDGTRIIADNILAIVVPTKDIIKNKELLSEIKIIGKGEARYYVNGKMTKGSWAKTSVSAKMQFLDDKGEVVKIKPGKTWIQVIPDWESVSTKQ